MEQASTIVIAILSNTLRQVTFFYGSLLFAGLLLSIASRGVHNMVGRTFGPAVNQYLTGWIGTPVHEAGHLIFCLLFRHQIQSVKFWNRDQNGPAGSVVHRYNRRNLYQQIGNFFIAIGPLLLGSTLILSLALALAPQIIPEQSAPVDGARINPYLFSGWHTLHQLVAVLLLFNWQAWLFTWLALSIAAHMELSWTDLKGIGPGLLAGILLLLLLNSIYTLLPQFAAPLSNTLHVLFFQLTAALQLAVSLSSTLLVVSWLLLAPFYALCNRRLLLPW